MITREQLSRLLVALHNACMLFDKEIKNYEHKELIIKEKQYFSLCNDRNTLKELMLEVKTIEYTIVKELLAQFNDEKYKQSWDNVKTWTDKKGKVKVLDTHNYDLSIEVLNNFEKYLKTKYIDNINELENELIL